ncbi:MAG: ATP-binding protein [Thermoplasmata archaeon]|nr:ATP-binding protein [Thermoplasmata archaeon]
MEEVGKIVSSSTSSFTFSASREVKKFDYVCVEHNGLALAQIKEVKQDRHGTIGEAEIIGYENRKYMARSPFKVGSTVYKASYDAIKKIIGMEDDGIYIGLLKDTNMKVFLSPESIIKRHLCILAKSGSGKSYVMGVIVEEMIKKGLPVVIIDAHGEYTSLRHPNLDKQEFKAMKKFGVKPRSYIKNVVEFSPLIARNKNAVPLFLDELNMEFDEILQLVPKATPLQRGILYEAYKIAKEEKRVYKLEDIIEIVRQAKSNAKWNLLPQLEQIYATKIFSPNYTPIEEIVKKKRCSIINLKGTPPHIQEILVAQLLNRIFEERRKENIPPLLIVIEEAHRYCPERGEGKSMAGDIIKTIATEGRKFGVGLAIITQRPARVDKNVISQCNTHIILRTTNPNDLKAVISSVEGLTSSAASEIQRLPVGTAIIAGLPLQAPIFVEVRVRETMHGGK